MFKFLFGRRVTEDATPETMREQLSRALAEVNGLVAQLDPKPAVTLDPATGEISLALPDQMPDEALALPAPEETTADVAADDAATEGAEKPAA